MALNGTGNDFDLEKHGKVTPEAPKKSNLRATDNKESSKQNTEEETNKEMDTGEGASAVIAEKSKSQTTEAGTGEKEESDKELKVDSADLTSNEHGNQDLNDSDSNNSHGNYPFVSKFA